MVKKTFKWRKVNSYSFILDTSQIFVFSFSHFKFLFYFNSIYFAFWWHSWMFVSLIEGADVLRIHTEYKIWKISICIAVLAEMQYMECHMVCLPLSLREKPYVNFTSCKKNKCSFICMLNTLKILVSPGYKWENSELYFVSILLFPMHSEK